ncbi:sporulation protein, partial [Geobacillus stearothermophilus]|uniref:sporulation protein n=1 Tax=Geobacillus stearothermophilus TaxID=1422 RepID=UPI003D1FD7D1
MLFKKLLSSIGIGAATVDTKLAKAQYVQGETVEGVVDIRGGSVEQHIDEIYLALATTYIREIDDKKFEEKAVLARYKVSGPLTIAPNETKTIPFQFALPYDVPVTLGSSRVWLQTGLDNEPPPLIEVGVSCFPFGGGCMIGWLSAYLQAT